MTCEHCEAAKMSLHYGRLSAACHGCRVRTVARGPQFAEARSAGRLTPTYIGMMSRLFGAEWRLAHDEVKAEGLRIASLQRAMEGIR